MSLLTSLTFPECSQSNKVCDLKISMPILVYIQVGSVNRVKNNVNTDNLGLLCFREVNEFEIKYISTCFNRLFIALMVRTIMVSLELFQIYVLLMSQFCWVLRRNNESILITQRNQSMDY